MKVLYVSLVIVLIDQITKFLVKGLEIPFIGIVLHGMPLGSSIPVLGDFLKITFIENPGMAFGIEIGGKFFLTFFSIVASLGILAYLYYVRNEKFIFRLSLAFILGGAIGNLIDRTFYGILYGEGPLFYGKVVDFIDVDFFNITLGSFHLSRFWIFNIADSAVTIGVLMMLLFHRSFIKEDDGVSQSMNETSTVHNSSDSISS
ncbi:MAG: signal peptidase II [Bacteroidetes bacterium]|nr:signal peptidase II [Bacteroidota bacterium]